MELSFVMLVVLLGPMKKVRKKKWEAAMEVLRAEAEGGRR